MKFSIILSLMIVTIFTFTVFNSNDLINASSILNSASNDSKLISSETNNKVITVTVKKISQTRIKEFDVASFGQQTSFYNDELIRKDSIDYLHNLILKPKGKNEWSYIFPTIQFLIKITI